MVALFILLSLLSLLGLFARVVIRNFVVIMNQKNSKYIFSLLSHSEYENRLRGYLFFSGSGVNSLDSALYLTGRVKEVVIKKTDNTANYICHNDRSRSACDTHNVFV